MNVKELIEALSKCPPDAEIFCMSTTIENVILKVITVISGDEDVVEENSVELS